MAHSHAHGHAHKRRPPDLRRTWLFVAGADAGAQTAALDAQPDVIVPDLEDFTPPPLRPRAREMILAFLEKVRKRGIGLPWTGMRKPGHQPFHLADGRGLGGAILLRPALDLPRDITFGPAVSTRSRWRVGTT